MKKAKARRKRWLNKHSKRMKKEIFKKAWRDHFVRCGILKDENY